MTLILLILLAGVSLGWLLRRQSRVISASEKLLTWSIYLLLFLLGISIGTNKEIVSNIGTLGMQSLGISILSVLGSVVAGVFCYRLFFIKK